MKTNLTPAGTGLLALIALSTLIPAASANAGPGSALSFDGVNDWVDVQAAVIPTSGDFTVECWVRCPTAPNSSREILSQGSSGNAFYIGTDANNNFRLGDTWVATDIPFPVGAWHHLAVISRSSVTPIAGLYVDGEFQGGLTRALANPQASTGFRLGRQYGTYGEYWPGQIDEVRIWNVVRSHVDIQANMNRALTGAEPGLVAYWRFDEGGGTTLADATGHGHTGTLLNSPAWTLSGVSFVPDATTGGATAISFTAATLTGSVNPGNLATTAWFQWGTDTNYGNITSAANLPANNASLDVSMALSNLTPGQTYHFQLVATNNAGITLGGHQSFATPPPVPPTVASTPATGISPSAATLNGIVNPNGLPATAWFEWGTDTNYGNLTGAANLAATETALACSQPLTGLTPIRPITSAPWPPTSSARTSARTSPFARGAPPTWSPPWPTTGLVRCVRSSLMPAVATSSFSPPMAPSR